ncbi:MAG TPA: ModD protein [Syntrophomonadaceae bacterium]|jgi:molybdenum transport protein|nr:ModD protein [Syntrophomonadaceae bacterium]
MVYINDDTLDRWIREDVPYIDLTTQTLNIGRKPGKMMFECREDAVVCGTEEAERILQKLNVKTFWRMPSGDKVQPHTVVLEAEGDAAGLHMAWKVCQNLLEYATGVATRTALIVTRAREANPEVQVVSTRKIIPGTKHLALKGVLAGGGMPHRLGISETILVFAQHTNFMGGLEGFMRQVDQLKKRNPEKKIIAEAGTAEEGISLVKAGVDGVQFDKLDNQLLAEAVKQIRSFNTAVTILASGGINADNAGQVARTGVDVVVTSAMYHGRPADYGVRISAL